MIEYELPYPPSLSHYYRHVAIGRGVRVYVSEEGKRYRVDVLAAVLRAGRMRAPEGARLRVEVDLYPPDRRASDLDNRLKGLLDALTHAQVYADDSLIDALAVRRMAVWKGGRAVVRIDALEVPCNT